MKKRSEKRYALMTMLYQYLLLGDDFCPLRQCIEKEKDLMADDFCRIIAYEVLKNEKRFIDLINKQLQNWTFDRLGKVEQAILLLGCAEIHADINEKAVVIDEAVNLTKKYCEADSYKLINATLDKI